MKMEIRGNSVTLDGYVNVTNRDSRMLPSPKGAFIEQITSKTFEKALSKGGNVDLLFNHNENRKLGSTEAGNLELFEDNIGLRARYTIDDPEVVQKAKDGKLTGHSFGFVATEQRWVESEGCLRRYVDGLDLKEISVLDVSPAYTGTSIEMRGQDLIERRLEEAEMIVVTTEDKENVSVADETNPTEDVVHEDQSVEPRDFTRYKHEIEILKIKGGLY